MYEYLNPSPFLSSQVLKHINKYNWPLPWLLDTMSIAKKNLIDTIKKYGCHWWGSIHDE